MGFTELTYEQLYFLGEILNASYIDYRYIKDMPDIQKQYTYKKNQSISALLTAGIVNEDFFGNLKVVPEYAKMLEPVFFGEEEYCVETSDGQIYLFHVKDGHMTDVTITGGGLRIGKSFNHMSAAIFGTLKMVFARAEKEAFRTDIKEVVISCRYAKIGVGGMEQQLIWDKGVVFIKERNGELRRVEQLEAIDAVTDRLRGGFYERQ